MPGDGRVSLGNSLSLVIPAFRQIIHVYCLYLAPLVIPVVRQVSSGDWLSLVISAFPQV